MWVYSVAFENGEDPRDSAFVMVRSRKRGGWEMPGGGLEKGEDPLHGAVREFREETGMELLTSPNWVTRYEKGYIFFGYYVPDRKMEPTAEIVEVGFFRSLPDVLAFPFVEYIPIIGKGRKILALADE